MKLVKATEFSTKNMLKLGFLLLLFVLLSSMSENVEASSRGGFRYEKPGFQLLSKLDTESEEINNFPEHSVQVIPRSPSEIMGSRVKGYELFQIASPDGDNPTPETPNGRSPGLSP